MKPYAQKREPQKNPIEAFSEDVATGVRIAATIGLMALDALVGKLGYELRVKDSVRLRPFRRAVAKPKGNAYRDAVKAKAKPKAKEPRPK
jgi:hypothetical protein